MFDRIQDAFHIASPQLALLELSKCKLTTQPEFHSGRGLFFTSRLFDVFDLYANQLTYQHNHWQRKEWLKAKPLGTSGTALSISLALNSARTLEDVVSFHGHDADDLSFSRTEVAMRLAHAAGEALESHAQAKRIANRLDAFDTVDLDFEGVDAIGQGFADELFRVFARAHPKVLLQPRNMNARVAAMVAQATEVPTGSSQEC